MRTRAGRFFVAALLVAGVRSADAQVSGYAIAGLSGFSGFFGSNASGFHAAGGAEALVRGRAGLGAEFGIIGNSSGGLWIYSVNGVMHILPARNPRGVSPFISGGYTHMSSGEGDFDAWNVGGGVDIWPKDRVGVRLDVRDHVRPDSRGTVHYWSIRGGIVFR